jgi:CRP-like cAMP-binding protein
VGTTDVLVGRPYARTATMETEARLFRLPAAIWFEVMQDRPAVVLNALIGFARNVTGLYARLAPHGGFPPAAEGAGRAGALDVETLVGRVRALASAPLLRGVPVQILTELAAVAGVQALEPGEVLFGAGLPPGRVFLVARGRVEATRAEPAVAAAFGPGSIVGGAVCLGDPDGAWAARALERSQVLSFSAEDLFDHLEEHQSGIRAMMAATALERERLSEELAAQSGELVLR